MADQKQGAASTAAPKTKIGQIGTSLPIVYRLFFLLIEPISALVGAYYAQFGQSEYLRLTHAASAPATESSSIPTGTSIVLSQLANLYFFFALNEAIVLRSTSDLRVWKAVLFCLLVADFGHLYTLRELGLDIYWSVARWNAIHYGNIPFVVLGACFRLAFIAGVGINTSQGKRKVKK